MALRIRYASTPGASLGYSIERLADGLYYDFSNAVFSAAPTTQINALTATTGNLVGLYRDTITSTPQTVFANGEYAVNIHNIGSSNVVIGVLGAIMANGDSAPILALGGTDPWAISLPGSYATGTAGAILGTYLDARVSTRSTYAGGAVASVTAPVSVGTVSDKSGYSLAASGLDGVQVEPGVNIRQALSPILAAAAGTLSGAGTGTIVIRGGNVATTRITATTDNAGNRTTVTLSLPN